MIRTVFACSALLLAVSVAGAEMYQWIDDKGVVTYKDTPPPASKKKKMVRVYSDSDFDVAPAIPAAPRTEPRHSSVTTAQPAPAAQPRFTGTVEIYLTDWCGYCKKALQYMDSKGIRYVAYNIDRDSAAKQRHQALGGRGVPLIVIGSNKMSGFSPEVLDYYMSRSK